MVREGELQAAAGEGDRAAVGAETPRKTRGRGLRTRTGWYEIYLARPPNVVSVTNICWSAFAVSPAASAMSSAMRQSLHVDSANALKSRASIPIMHSIHSREHPSRLSKFHRMTQDCTTLLWRPPRLRAPLSSMSQARASITDTEVPRLVLVLQVTLLPPTVETRW